MKFFTDKTVRNEYLMIQIKQYLRMKDFSQYKEVFIDPGVYELKKSPVYSWESKINILEFLNTLLEHHYFACDYPCDMNTAFTDTFLIKSWDNAVKYCAHPHYIVAVQSKLNRYDSFVEWFDRYNDLPLASGILGLGNFCRILECTEFIKHAIPYAFKNSKTKRIHIYGLSMKNIKFAHDMARRHGIELSIDSTKWTRAITSELKVANGGKASCMKHNRQEFFNEYLRVIKNKGVSLQNDYVEEEAEE